MSESTPPTQQDQVEQPNPLEIFWEKHRFKVTAAATLLLAGLVINYGLQYMARQETNATWNSFATASGIDQAYAQDGSLASLLDNMNQGQEQDDQNRLMWAQYYLSTAQQEQVTERAKDLKGSSKAGLEEAIASAASKPSEPLLIWIAAHRAAFEEQWEEALGHLGNLEDRFPSHFLCLASDYPVQHRRDKNEGKDKEDDSGKKMDPDLVEPEVGSAVKLAIAAIKAQQAFRAANDYLYKAPEPDSGPTVLVTTTHGNFKIRLYSKRAPKHAEQFLKLCKDAEGEFYKGQHIDEITRAGSESQNPDQAMELHFGLPSSKDADSSKWTKTDPSGTILDFEDNDLSHFPGMVAAATESEGKSSGERIWINANDCASQSNYDGQRVIFGRIVEGLDVIESICESPFESEQDSRSGRGRPSERIKIESVTVIDG